MRADFYNPICQFLVAVTNPLLIPLRRVIPSFGQLDTASVALMIALELISVATVNYIAGGPLAPPAMIMLAVSKLLLTLLWIYFFLIIINKSKSR